MKSFRDYLIEVELSEDNPTVGDVFELEIARDETLIETYIVDVLEDGIVIEADETTMRILEHVGYLNENPTNMPPATTTISPIHSNANQERSDDDDLEEGEQPDYPHTGTGTSQNMQMAVDMARHQAKANMMRSIHGDNFQDKTLPDYDEDKVQLVPGQKPGTYQATIKMRQRPTNEAEYRGRKVPLGKPMAGDVKKSKVYVKNAKGNVVKVNFGDPNMKIKKSNPKRRKSFRARHNCANPGPRTSARYWSCRAW